MLLDLGYIRLRGHIPHVHCSIIVSKGENVGVVRMEGNASGIFRIGDDVDEDTVNKEQMQAASISYDSNKMLRCCALPRSVNLNDLLLAGFQIVDHNSILFEQTRNKLASSAMSLRLHTPQPTKSIVSRDTMHACTPLRRGLMCSEGKGVLCHPCSASVPRREPQHNPHTMHVYPCVLALSMSHEHLL